MEKNNVRIHIRDSYVNISGMCVNTLKAEPAVGNLTLPHRASKTRTESPWGSTEIEERGVSPTSLPRALVPTRSLEAKRRSSSGVDHLPGSASGMTWNLAHLDTQCEQGALGRPSSRESNLGSKQTCGDMKCVALLVTTWYPHTNKIPPSL